MRIDLGLEMLNTKVARWACSGRAPGKCSPQPPYPRVEDFPLKSRARRSTGNNNRHTHFAFGPSLKQYNPGLSFAVVVPWEG